MYNGKQCDFLQKKERKKWQRKKKAALAHYIFAGLVLGDSGGGCIDENAMRLRWNPVSVRNVFLYLSEILCSADCACSRL